MDNDPKEEELRWLIARAEEIIVRMDTDMLHGPTPFKHEAQSSFEDRAVKIHEAKRKFRDYALFWREQLKHQLKKVAPFGLLLLFISPVEALTCPAGTKEKCLCVATPIPTPTKTITPTATPSPTPTFSNIAIPEYSKWESNMKSYGITHCGTLKGTATFDTKLAATYYDAARIFYQVYDYTDDVNWLACADAAHATYRDKYIFPNNGGVPGYWSFTEGLAKDGSTTSKNALGLVAKNAAYHGDLTPLSWTEDSTMSREVAYIIEAYLNAEAMGFPKRPRLTDMVNQAFGHIDQWFVKKTAPYVRPFMFALTAEALIQNHNKYPDARTLPAIQTGADWVWNNCWLSANKAFKYTDRPHETGGTEPAPDLNLLIAPVYSWLWMKTGDIKYRDRFDEIFAGGVTQSYLTNAKQYMQSYRWSFDGVNWRKK